MSFRPIVRILFPALLATLPTVSPAQSVLPAQSRELLGRHVVRPGETLEGIAAYYFGTSERWPEIWKLNRGVGDPNLITPGQILTIEIPASLPPQAARIAAKSRKVEEQRRPLDFEDVRVNDLLKPLDVVRTGDASSTELFFGDETSLVLTEQTQIVLGEQQRDRTTIDRQEIRIEFGQADLESQPAPGSRVEVEIIMGSTIVAPKPAAPGETVKARTRRPSQQSDDALLMVYEGRSDIAAGGQRVAVDQGMGTTVATGGAPTPPERLLAAPRIVRPEQDSRWDDPAPIFEWERVEGADSYSVEICLDARCTELVEKASDLRATRWQAQRRLAPATYHWRVTARSPSGLDGFPGSEVGFAVVAERIERLQPRATVSFAGPMVGVANRLVVGIGAEISADVADDESGLREWQRLFDGEAVDESGWTSRVWTSGAHSASVRAVDNQGNVLTLEPEPFVYDPDPPVIGWGVEDGGELGRAQGPSSSELNLLIEKQEFGVWSRATGKNLSPLVWTSSRVKWLAMEYGDWKIASDRPFIILRARKKAVRLEPVGHAVEKKDRGLWIHATDEGCGVESMRYQLFKGPQGQDVLVIEATDALDNTTRVVWTLGRE